MKIWCIFMFTTIEGEQAYGRKPLYLVFPARESVEAVGRPPSYQNARGGQMDGRKPFYLTFRVREGLELWLCWGMGGNRNSMCWHIEFLVGLGVC